MIDAFTLALGTSAGRRAPADWVVPQGAYAFVLGDEFGRVARLRRGDFVEALQAGTVAADATRLHCRVALRYRASAEHWTFQFLVDGIVVAAHPITRSLELVDVGVNLASFAGVGTHRIAFRLTLDDVPGTRTIVDVPVPAAYVDAILIETMTGVSIANRAPEMGDEEAPADTTIAFDLFETSGVGVSGIHVYVNDVLAFDGIDFQPGFDGPASALTPGPLADTTLHLVVDPTTNFDSQTVVAVHVTGSVGGVPALDTTYSFTIADTIGPRLVSAVATDRRTVRVVFSEDVDVTDGVGGALLPANWMFTVVSTSIYDGLPAVPLAVSSVLFAASNAVDVVTDLEMTEGALYQVAALNVDDAHGNPVMAPTNAIVFAGYAKPKPAGRDFDLYEQLPEKNRVDDESRDLKRFIACFQENVDMLLGDIDDWTTILDPDVAAERFIDAMLDDLGNPFSFELALIDKRRLVRVLVPIYKQKGTDDGIVNAVRFFVGVEVTIRTPAFLDVWRLGDDELGVDTTLGTSDAHTRYSFEIVSPIVLTAEQRERVLGIAGYMKGERTHIISIVEPTPPPALPDHWELGLSELGLTTTLH